MTDENNVVVEMTDGNGVAIEMKDGRNNAAVQMTDVGWSDPTSLRDVGHPQRVSFEIQGSLHYAALRSR
jgi:hypothetical protein